MSLFQRFFAATITLVPYLTFLLPLTTVAELISTAVSLPGSSLWG